MTLLTKDEIEKLWDKLSGDKLGCTRIERVHKRGGFFFEFANYVANAQHEADVNRDTKALAWDKLQKNLGEAIGLDVDNLLAQLDDYILEAKSELADIAMRAGEHKKTVNLRTVN